MIAAAGGGLLLVSIGLGIALIVKVAGGAAKAAGKTASASTELLANAEHGASNMGVDDVVKQQKPEPRKQSRKNGEPPHVEWHATEPGINVVQPDGMPEGMQLSTR